MSRERFLRLVLAPTLLFLVFTGTALALALLHPAKPGTPKTSGNVKLGDPYNGETIFSTTCAGCHGQGGKGGIGPKLAGAGIPIAAVKAQIDNGGGSMPAGLVKGKQEADVLAYVAGILESP